MDSKIVYNNEQLELCDDFIDVGYMAENFEAINPEGDLIEVRRSHSDGAMTLLISFPNIEDFLEEIRYLDELLSHLQVKVHCYLLLNNSRTSKEIAAFKSFSVLFDSEEEFGNMYGTKIVSGSLKEALTKALFLISKDGAIFYIDMPSNLHEPLDSERLHVELNKAYSTYTGVGCHGWYKKKS